MAFLLSFVLMNNNYDIAFNYFGTFRYWRILLSIWTFEPFSFFKIFSRIDLYRFISKRVIVLGLVLKIFFLHILVLKIFSFYRVVFKRFSFHRLLKRLFFENFDLLVFVTLRIDSTFLFSMRLFCIILQWQNIRFV